MQLVSQHFCYLIYYSIKIIKFQHNKSYIFSSYHICENTLVDLHMYFRFFKEHRVLPLCSLENYKNGVSRSSNMHRRHIYLYSLHRRSIIIIVVVVTEFRIHEMFEFYVSFFVSASISVKHIYRF